MHISAVSINQLILSYLIWKFLIKIFYVQSVKEKNNKKNDIYIYFITNYRREMKLVLIIMDYCLLQFDILKIFLGVVCMEVST